jgi:hypothetical protein
MFVEHIMLRLYFASICCLLVACQSGHIRSINLGGGITAEGRIAPDTVFDGTIKFYDAKSNVLVEEGNYVNGKKTGIDIFYYKNGTVQSKAEFADGEQNGYSFNYDSSGKLEQKSYNYYGLNVGGSANYLNDSIKEYYFYDLDENVLMYLEYDSIRGKQLGKIQPTLFFFHDSHYQPYDSHGMAHTSRSYFVYTPNPPKFDFRYSFVAIDSSFKVLSVLREIGNNQPWSIVNLDWQPDHPNQQLALRLKVRDSINNVNMTAFKIVKF